MKMVARTVALAFVLLASAAPILAQEIRGTPLTGQAGVQITTSDLMAQERTHRILNAGAPQSIRLKPVLRPDRRNLPSGPGATADQGTTSALRPPSLNAQTLSTTFLGATLADTNAFPPDSMGTVGPTQFIVAVNGRLRSFNKTTGVADGVLNINPDVFFASVMTPTGGGITSNFTSDPRIRYDRFSARWFIEIIDVPNSFGGTNALFTNRSMLAVSDAASAGVISGTTVWTFYFFQAGSSQFADYCTLGIDVNALYIGCNMFATGTTNPYAGTDGYVVRKTSVLSGGPIAVTQFDLVPLPSSAGPFTPQGVDNFDATATEGYFVGVDNLTFSTLMFRRVSNPGSASPTISANISVAVAATSFPFLVPHLGNTGGTNGQLDALDDRLFAAHIRNGHLFTAHNIAMSPAGVATSNTSNGRNGARWYEFQNLSTTPTAVQTGSVFDAVGLPNAHWYWIPTIMSSGQGHAALGFSIAGANFRADAGFTGRLASDAANTMPGPLTAITASTFAYNPPSDPGSANGRRWGDYSYTSVDPIDDMTIWTIQEFTNATNSYGVQAAKLKAPPPATPASSAPASIPTGQASVIVVVTGTSASGSGFFDPGPNLAPPALPFNHIAASVTGGVTVNSVTYVDPTHVSLNLSTLAASPGAQNITITNPDGQSATGIGAITLTGPVTHFSVSAPASATAGSAFSFTVNALDAANTIVPGYSGTVHFTSSDGGATLPADTTLVSGTGTFSATLVTAGNQTLTATDTVTASITGTSGAIAVSAAAATHFSVSAPASATAGTSFSFTVTAQDAFNNTATGYAGTVHFTSSDGAAVLPGDATLTSGAGTFSATLNTLGGQTLTATDTVTASITGTSGIIAVGAGTATHFMVSAPASATAGTSFSFTVTALDALNNVATGYAGTVHFTSSDGAAALPGDATLTSGTGTFSATLSTVGSQTLTATDTVTASITGTSGTIAVGAGPATHFAVSAPASATAGTSFSFTVTALDAFNNVATGYAGTVHFTSTDGLAVLPADSTLASGTGTFSATLKTAGNQTLTATDTVTASITGTSGAIAVGAAAATHFSVSAPPTATAGTSFNFTVTAQDAFNNTATAYAGTVHFTSTDIASVLPADSTLASGTGTFSVTLKTAGNQTLTATDTVTASITGTSGAIAVSAGAATHFTVSAPASATAGTSFSFTVTAQDAFNNTATGYAGTVHFTSSDGAASLPANSTLTSGTGTFSATLNTPPSQTLTATDTVTASITGTSSAIAVSAGAATHFSVSAPASATAGTAFNFTVTALDAFNNTVTGYAGTVHFTSSDGAAVLPANSTLTSGTGTFSATLNTPPSQTITATDTVTASITGTSGAIAVSAGAATHFSVSAPPTATAGTAFNFTVTALDAANNTATGYAGTVHFTSSDGAAVLPANSTLTSGTGTFSATLNTVPSQTITATDTVTASITGTSNAIALNGATPTFASAVSRKVHGTAGTFDLALSLVAPPAINHNPTTEPRTGPTQTIVFVFDKPVISGNAVVTEGVATLGTPTFAGNEMTVPLTGVNNKQYVTVDVSNVAAADGGTGGSGSVRIGLLVGNVTMSRQVLPSDVGLVRSHLLEDVGPTNFLFSVTLGNKVLPADVGLTRSNLLMTLPAP